MEIFGFAREMSGQTAQLVGQMRDQNQNQINLILAQAEAHKQEARRREEMQWVEAKRREEIQREEAKPVSYTHLTLPTKRIV